MSRREGTCKEPLVIDISDGGDASPGSHGGLEKRCNEQLKLICAPVKGMMG